jgi:hypothetical protein
MELEARGLLIFTTPDPTTISAVLMHAYWRNPVIALGLFGGPEPIGGTGGGIAWNVGGEMQVYLNAVTLYLQAAKIIVGGATPGTGWYARFSARFFPTSNVRLEAGIRVLGLETTTVFTLFGTGEYQLPNSPLSLLFTVRRLNLETQQGTTFQAGIRFNFGGTLADQVAPMDTLPLLF